MSHPYETAALSIIENLHHAEDDLVGRAVVTFGSEAGTVRALKLDEHHGLCFTIDAEAPGLADKDHFCRWYPVSTIRHRE